MLQIPVFRNKNERTEKILFGLFTVCNLLPLFMVKIFPTLDGAAHLYNTTLIRNLLTGNDFLQQFFILNNEPVPNWTGHMLLMLLTLFLPAWIAEKAVMILIITGLPVAFRYLVTAINPQNRYLSFLAFPFSYSFAFFMGFYNFYIALVLMLITIGYWHRYAAVNLQWRKLIIMCCLITLVYFSHIMIYALLCFFMGILIVEEGISDNLKQTGKNWWNKSLKKTGLLFLICLPTLILFAWYFLSRPSPDEIGYLKTSELWNGLLKGAPFMVFGEEEGQNTRLLFWLLAIPACLSLLLGTIKRGGSYLLSGTIRNVWFWIMIILLIMYFLFPDSLKWTSYISSRLGLLVFIFGAVWVSALEYPKQAGMLFPVAALCITIPLHVKFHESITPLAEMAESCYDAGEIIRPNTTVFPLNYDHWFAGHFSNYLAAEKPVVVLENYESGVDFFPIRWNMVKIPNTLIGKTSCYDIPCAYWVFDSSHVAMKIDYIFVLGNQDASTDSCHRELRKTIMNSYDLVSNSEIYELFQVRKP